jgi:hypothetical protein
MDVGRRRRVLDQLHQLIAVDHRAGRQRHRLADLEVVETFELFSPREAAHILREQSGAGEEVHPACPQGGLDHFGVGPPQIDGRESVQREAAKEFHPAGVVGVNTMHVVGSLAPLLLQRQMRLREQIKGRAIPTFMAKAPVGWSRLEDPVFPGRAWRAACERPCSLGAGAPKVDQPDWRYGKVISPILPGLQSGPRGLTAQESRHTPTKLLVEPIGFRSGIIARIPRPSLCSREGWGRLIIGHGALLPDTASAMRNSAD